MKKDQTQKVDDEGGLGQNYLFLLSWTLTSNSPPATPPIVTLATLANDALPDWLYDRIETDSGTKPNFVYTDFIPHHGLDVIVRYNF